MTSRPRPGNPTRLGVLLVVLAALTSCDTDHGPVLPDPTEPPDSPSPAIVSDPITATIAGGLAGVAMSATSVTYVSLLPGTFPSGRTAGITNLRTSVSVAAAVLNGGLDPLAVAGVAGDRLAFAIDTGGAQPVRFDQLVPQFYAVTVVRTDPPAGKRDVPLNSRARIIFSEPVDRVTVTPTSLVLSQAGGRVAGEVDVSADGLEATFQPAADLLPGTEYSLTVAAGIRDLDGSSLGSTLTAGFTTVPGSAAPAPKGMLAFETHRGIHIANLDGSGLRALTPGEVGSDVGAAWSPDGQRIAFSRHDADYGASLAVMNADGTSLRWLSPDGAYDADPTWSPDGRRIAFENRRDNRSGGHIFVMDADGSHRVQLTSNSQPNFRPAWSPDGSRIAYVTTSYPGGVGIYLINPDGSGRVRLTPGSLQGSDPAWSPDGTRVAFIGLDEDGTQLSTINADGTGLVKLTSGLPGTGEPSWSPDGSMIAFTVYSFCDPWGYPPCTGNEVRLPPLWVVRVSDGYFFPLPFPQSSGWHASWRPTYRGGSDPWGY
jgi:dipeptidyl aminopeptidase/acylaminoacyl peptidase